MQAAKDTQGRGKKRKAGSKPGEQQVNKAQACYQSLYKFLELS